jgi:hypothetical protein
MGTPSVKPTGPTIHLSCCATSNCEDEQQHHGCSMSEPIHYPRVAKVCIPSKLVTQVSFKVGQYDLGPAARP